MSGFQTPEPNEQAGNPEVVPGVEPPEAETHEASSSASPSAPDVESLTKQLRDLQVLDDKTTVDDLRRYKQEMFKAQEERANTLKRLQPVEPLLSRLEQDREFSSYLYEQANAFYENRNGQMDPGIAAYLNPVMADLNTLKSQLAERQMMDQFDHLSKDYGEDNITDDVKRDLLLEARATQNWDVESIFLKKYGRQLLQKSRSEGTKEAVETITKNNNAYRQTPSAAPAAAVNPANMTPDQREAAEAAEIRRILRDSKYAREVSANIG